MIYQVTTVINWTFLSQQQPQIILLKEGTDSSQGKPQLISNINACQTVAEAVRTTLGPRGMDKLIVDNNGKGTISNDGATILKLLDIVHPAAKTLVDIAKSQDAEVNYKFSDLYSAISFHVIIDKIFDWLLLIPRILKETARLSILWRHIIDS